MIGNQPAVHNAIVNTPLLRLVDCRSHVLYGYYRYSEFEIESPGFINHFRHANFELICGREGIPPKNTSNIIIVEKYAKLCV